MKPWARKAGKSCSLSKGRYGLGAVDLIIANEKDVNVTAIVAILSENSQCIAT